MLDRAAEHDKENTLPEIAAALLKAELLNKLHAAALVAREIPLEPEATNFMTRMIRLEALNVELSSALAECKFEEFAAKPEESDEEKKLRQKLTKLSLEIDCFLYFCATAAELFAAITDEIIWNQFDANRVIDHLAEARQGLELSTGVALFRLDELRKRCSFDPRPQAADGGDPHDG
jgi:hypothetical protein